MYVHASRDEFLCNGYDLADVPSSITNEENRTTIQHQKKST